MKNFDLYLPAAQFAINSAARRIHEYTVHDLDVRVMSLSLGGGCDLTPVEKEQLIAFRSNGFNVQALFSPLFRQGTDGWKRQRSPF